VNGNGTYTAGTMLGTSGTVAGTYTWSAHYSGDNTNGSANDQGGSAEQTVVSPAKPNVVTTANPSSVTLGSSGATLSDSAVLSGGFFETGTLTFTLTGPGGFSFTTTDTVNGNGTYTASDTLTAGAATGTYTWSVVYSGDGNNVTAVDQGGTAEQTVVSAPAPGEVRMTGGGSVFLPGPVLGPNGQNTVVGGPAGTRVTHGFQLHCSPGPNGIQNVNNRLEINWNPATNTFNSGAQHFHLSYLTAITCEKDPNINPAPPPFTANLMNTLIGAGVGEFSGTVGGVTYKKALATVTFILTDAGEPGTSDTASYIVTIISNGLIVLNTGDSNGDGKRDITDYNALKTPFTLVPPTSSSDPGQPDIPNQLFLFKGNQQIHLEIPPLVVVTPQVTVAQNQITQSLNSLNSTTLTQSQVDNYMQQLLIESAQLNLAVAGDTIGGAVFNDANQNGVWDYGETALSGTTVKLYNQAGHLVATTRTDSTGVYGFNVAPGTYYVVFQKPNGSYVFSQEYGDNTFDSSDVNANGTTAMLTLSAGSFVGFVDAGLHKK
jgi:hypothetical protein